MVIQHYNKMSMDIDFPLAIQHYNKMSMDIDVPLAIQHYKMSMDIDVHGHTTLQDVHGH